MNVIEAVILGLVQGLTEFIPVSSSGHLVIAHNLLGVSETGLAFDVALHLGTLIALIGYFWHDLLRYAVSVFKKTEHSRLTWLLIGATVPAAIIGFLLEGAAESKFRSVRLVGMTMLLFGLIMLIAEHYYRRQSKYTSLDNVTTKQAMSMGLAQAAAIVPGVSRSGSTITMGLFTGLDRVAATRFSFLLGIPITAGAVLKVFSEGGVLHAAAQQQSVFAAGIITALISGLFAIRFMLGYLAKHGLQAFAYYRIALGLLLLVLFTLR
ncbi:MAG TPA: undecaprenyl-diphosphate phosphatase [Candidatus Limnocylindrales bacterium]|nr:undecaprenyl-diphosphate phosphatase [Candidatus Limnocylindrales bacterium]